MSTNKGIKGRRERRRKRFRIQMMIGGFSLALLLLIAGLSFYFVNKKNANKDADSKEPASSAKDINITNQKKQKEPVTLTVSSMGDCTLGTDEGFNRSTSLNAYFETNGAEYFFRSVKPILEKDDLSIVNMEGTLTKETSRADKTFAFKADPSYAAILTSGSVEATNMANNHSRDYGEQSLKDTLSALKNAGITTFGFEQTAVMEVKGIKIGLIGIYELAEHMGKEAQLKENIQKVKDEGAQLIIVNFHWGIERDARPNSTQVQLAHTAIDNGADLVIGHHPHVLQGIEKYKGKYIAYSLGNFCFGGNSNPQDKDTMIFQQTFTITEEGVEENDEINIIPCKLSSSNTKNDYQPTPAKGSEAERILNKIKERSEGL